MRTVAVLAPALAPGALLRRVPTWRPELPELFDTVRVVYLDGTGRRWTGTVVAVDAARRTYTVAVALPLFAGLGR